MEHPPSTKEVFSYFEEAAKHAEFARTKLAAANEKFRQRTGHTFEELTEKQLWDGSDRDMVRQLERGDNPWPTAAAFKLWVRTVEKKISRRKALLQRAHNDLKGATFHGR